MSVSSELLCSFELLKPLDSNALKSHIKKGRNKRNQMLNSPVSFCFTDYIIVCLLTTPISSPACERIPSECMTRYATHLSICRISCG